MNIHAHNPLTTAATTRVSVLRGVDAFLALERDWNELFARASQPHQVFQSHALLSIWTRAYAQMAHGAVVIAAWQGNRLVAALPLVRRRMLGGNFLQFMGSRISQFDDMLLDSAACGETVRAQIWATLRQLDADFLEVRRLRSDAAFNKLPAGPFRTIETLAAPMACLTARVGSDGPGDGYSAKDRSNYRRRIRRLNERGAFAMTTCEPGAQAVSLAMEAIAMKRAFLRRHGILSSAVNAPEFASFFAQAAADPASGLLVSTLELDGRPIAVDLSFICKTTGFGHVLASDPEFERDGVGSLLVHHVLANAKAAGAAAFDLLAPADPYKLRHSDGSTPVESRIYPFNLRGRLAAAAYGYGLPVARRATGALARLRSRAPEVAD